MAKVRFRARFYIIIAALLAALAAVAVILIHNRKDGRVETGEVTMSLSISAVIIRDEVCVTTQERYDRIEFSVLEGSYVEAGTPVADVYKWGYNEELMQSLLTVQKKILSSQLSQLVGVENSELSSVNTQISEKEDEIRLACLNGEEETGTDLLTLQNELKTLMQQRNAYLRQTVQTTEELNNLYLEEQNRESQIAEYKSTVSAASPGIISFYSDGYEQVLNREKLDMVSAALINSVLKGNSVSTSTVITENLLYRLTDREHFYLAFVTKATSPCRLVVGESYAVSLDGYSGEMTGTAIKSEVADNNVVNILEIDQDISELVDVRVIGITVKNTAQGSVVPTEAVLTDSGELEVEIRSGESSARIKVDVLAADDEKAVVRAQEGQSAVSAGQTYLKP